MPELREMDIDLDGVGHLLSDSQFAVPRYQRPYAWTDKHVNDLLDDFSDAIKRDDSEYFLGSVVVISRPPNDNTQVDTRFEVVDGQQRLATVSILIAAIRDYFAQTGDLNRANQIAAKYLVKSDLRTQELVAQLKLNASDNHYFVERILADPFSRSVDLRAQTPSQERIERCAVLAAERITSIVTQSHQPANALLDWIEFIQDRAKVIKVQVRDDANAFTIFETLNDRGLALAITDLIKNYLFSKARDRIDEVQSRWIQMAGMLEPLEGEELVLDFIRHYWSSVHGVTRKDQLFSGIRAGTDSRQKAVDLMSALETNALLYSAIVSPDAELWSERSLEHMRLLNMLGMIQIRPLLLAVLDKFSMPETEVVLKYSVSWAVRFLVAGVSGSGSLESHYAKRAQQIRENEITSAAELAAEMRAIVPSDTSFKQTFETISVAKANIARYYLRMLDYVRSGNSNPALTISGHVDAVNLEHVLPRRPGSAWNQFGEEEAEAYVWRLGNLALLESRVNRKLSNESFDVKKLTYAQQPFLLTKSISTRPSWTMTEIESRQKELARLAVAAWPI